MLPEAIFELNVSYLIVAGVLVIFFSLFGLNLKHPCQF